MNLRKLKKPTDTINGFSYTFSSLLIQKVNQLLEEGNLYKKHKWGEPSEPTPLTLNLCHYLKEQMPHCNWDLITHVPFNADEDIWKDKGEEVYGQYKKEIEGILDDAREFLKAFTEMPATMQKSIPKIQDGSALVTTFPHQRSLKYDWCNEWYNLGIALFEPVIERNVVFFEAEITFDIDIEAFKIKYALTLKKASVFRTEILLKDIAKWLEQKGYKLRRFDEKNNKGHLYADFKFLSINENEKWQDDFQIVRKARIRCSADILPITS